MALKILKELYNNKDCNSDFVFPSRKYPNEPTNINSAWKTALAKAGIEDFRFHDLRHTAATYLAQYKASQLDLSTILGHKSLEMVKRYSHLTHNHTKDVIKYMNDEVFEGWKTRDR